MPSPPTETDAPAGPTRRNPKLVIAILAAAVVVIAIVVVVVVKGRHHTKTLSPAALVPAPSSQLGPAAHELVSLLQQGRKATYHATYTSTGGATTGAQLALEIWQSPPRVREDTTRTQGATTNRASVFTNGATTTLCSQATGTGWTCQAVAPATFQDSGPSGVIAAVTSTLAGKQVTLAKDTIGGRAVECFQIGPVASGVKVCATDQGIPVLIAAPAVTYLMATLETTVPAGVFTAPAPVR